MEPSVPQIGLNDPMEHTEWEVARVLLSMKKEVPGPRSAQVVALNNPIILREILQQSSTPLKNCRLVCHSWNDMVLSLPNTRLVLNLNNNKLENDLRPFLKLCQNLECRLATRISADSTKGAGVTDRFTAKLTRLCEKFSEKVQILEICIHSEDCLPSIFDVLESSCQYLKQLRMRCDFTDGYVPSGEILVGPLPQKLNLTVFQLRSDVVAVSPTLASFAQLVISASPNLREVTLPWGIYPDFETSKCLDSLILELDDARPLDVALTQFKPSELIRILLQLADQLVSLAFSYSHNDDDKSMNEDYNLDLSTPSQLRLWVRMPKLETFENEMIDIIRHADLWQDIERMPALESLKIGKLSKMGTSVDAVLEKLAETKRNFPNVTNLKINELYDPKLLDGVKKAFPKLEILALVSVHKTDVGGMKLGPVLKACAGFVALNSLMLWLPAYPQRTMDLINALLEGRKLYEELNILEILMHKYDNRRHDLSKSETHYFKGMLLEMKGMHRVVIDNLHFGDESRRNMLDFMASEEMPVSKFRIF